MTNNTAPFNVDRQPFAFSDFATRSNDVMSTAHGTRWFDTCTAASASPSKHGGASS